jgi:hypothetical protein
LFSVWVIFAFQKGRFAFGRGRFAFRKGNFAFGRGNFAIRKGRFAFQRGRFTFRKGRFIFQRDNLPFRGLPSALLITRKLPLQVFFLVSYGCFVRILSNYK